MKINQISGQAGQTLYAFYNPYEWPHQWGKMLEVICQFIKSLKLINHNPVYFSRL